MLKRSLSLSLVTLLACGPTPLSSSPESRSADSRPAASVDDAKPSPTISEKTAGALKMAGYFNLYWDAKQGKLWLEIDKWGTEFLYQSSLPAGIGSNDIGLEPRQLGGQPNGGLER